jgi:hypothetical protein
MSARPLIAVEIGVYDELRTRNNFNCASQVIWLPTLPYKHGLIIDFHLPVRVTQFVKSVLLRSALKLRQLAEQGRARGRAGLSFSYDFIKTGRPSVTVAFNLVAVQR